MKFIKTVIFGMAYGVTSPVPGFDGGTFFILFNVYEDFINAAKLTNVRKKLPVVLPFVLGAVAGLFGISNLMMYLLYYHELIMYFSFAGLILGCTPMIYKRSALNLSKYKISLKSIVIFSISLILMLLLAFDGGADPQRYDSIYQLQITGPPLVWIFFASIISSIGMLIPGVGGAILMLVLGTYTAYIEALATFDFVVLITFVAGMTCGFLIGLRVVRKILHTFPGELYCAILGFTLGSVFIVFPGFVASFQGLLAALFGIFFTIVAYLFSNKENFK
jgi:putative membrane protein